MKQKIKWFIASMMVMVCLQAFADAPEGKYYVCFKGKFFLSRSATGPCVDQFGVPVEIKKGASGYSLMFLDNGRYLAQSGTTVKGDQSSAAYATFNNALGSDGYTICFTGDDCLGVADGKLYFASDPNAYESNDFDGWCQLLTQAERDAIVAESELAQIEAIAKAADINLTGEGDKMALFTEALKDFKVEDAIEYVSNPTLATSENGWTVNVMAGGSHLNYNDKPMTLYQNSAMEISQTIEVPNGIYRATIQNTYRSSGMGYLTNLSENDGISICNAYFAANDNKAEAVEWSTIRTSADRPYSRSHFDNFTTNPIYTTTVWAYVNNGKLTLKYAVPAIGANANVQDTYGWNWFTFANVTLTRYYKASEVADGPFDLYNEIANQSSDPSSYYAVRDDFNQQYAEGTMSDDDVETAKATMRTELFKLMDAVPALSGQYDITSFITNPSFSTSIKGWTIKANSFANSSNVAESYQKQSAQIYQAIPNMPKGEYTIKVQGFCRSGGWKKGLANYERGKENMKAKIYMDATSNYKLLKSIFADGCYMLTGMHHKSADVFAVASGRGFPHSRYININERRDSIPTVDIAKQALEHGHYWNEFTANHAKDGALTIGIIMAGGLADSWIVVDNFRLYYGASGPVTIAEGDDLPPVSADTYTGIVLKKQFKANELTPLAVPCDIPASKFKAVYAIGSLDVETQTAVLCPVDHVSANVPCYVVTDQDVDEITVDENTYIAAAQPDQLPVMWDGGLVYRVPGTFTWKTEAIDKKEYDAAHFTKFECVDAQNLDFVANIENVRARQFLENTDYSRPDAPSVIGNYFKPAPPRLDIPHNIGVPVPADKVKGAVVKYGLKQDFSDAKSWLVLDGSDMAYMPNLVPGNTYYFKVEAGTEILTQGKVHVEGTVRMVYAPSINNIRDIGGWKVMDGRTVRYGKIFRGGEVNGLHQSDKDDRQVLIDLGVGAEIDLRKDNTYDSANGGVGRCEFGFGKDDYFLREGGYDCKVEHLKAADSKARFKEWFPFIVDHLKEGKSIYYHCVWGADRTGLVSVLLEGLLGFSQEQMNLEYELTSLSFAGLRPKGGYEDGDHQDLIEYIKTFDGKEIAQRQGREEMLRDKFDTYWIQEVGITEEQIEEFRNIMLVGEEETDIKDINLQENAGQSGIMAVYSITGAELPSSSLSQPGIYVVKYSDGTSKKIVVK